MSKVVKSIFGGTDKTALRAQQSANESTQQFISQQAQQAREDVLNLNPAADANRNAGFQAGLDVLGQTIPQQFQALRQGNVGAQQTLIDGLPQLRNAILGLPTDFSSLTPQGINVDTSFASQTLPDFISTPEALGRVRDPVIGPNTPPRFNFQDFLTGRGANFNFGGRPNVFQP